MMSMKYHESYECVKKIKKFIHDLYGTNLTKEEMLYLIVHISKSYKIINQLFDNEENSCGI